MTWETLRKYKGERIPWVIHDCTESGSCPFCRKRKREFIRAKKQPAAATDSALLDAMQASRWAISPQCNGGWVIEGDTGGEDADVFEIVRTRGDIREAIRNAITQEAMSAAATSGEEVQP